MYFPRRNDFDVFDFFPDTFFQKEQQRMKTDIEELEDKYILTVDIPGVQKENIKMEMEGGYLTIQVKEEKNTSSIQEHYVKKERFSGECFRSFYIGEEVHQEEIKARYTNGTLIIEIPKKENKGDNKTKKMIAIED